MRTDVVVRVRCNNKNFYLRLLLCTNLCQNMNANITPCNKIINQVDLNDNILKVCKDDCVFSSENIEIHIFYSGVYNQVITIYICKYLIISKVLTRYHTIHLNSFIHFQ